MSRKAAENAKNFDFANAIDSFLCAFAALRGKFIFLAQAPGRKPG